MHLVALIEQDLDDNVEERSEPTREVVADADDYDGAVQQIRDQLPTGWRVIWLRVPERR